MSIDPKTFRLVVMFLGLALLVLIAAMTVLAILGRNDPQAFDVALGSDLGALAALFVTPHSSEPTPVAVVGQPLAVDPVDDAAGITTSRVTTKKAADTGRN